MKSNLSKQPKAMYNNRRQDRLFENRISGRKQTFKAFRKEEALIGN